eukprot:439406-Rhodomonas_salina.1
MRGMLPSSGTESTRQTIATSSGRTQGARFGGGLGWGIGFERAGSVFKLGSCEMLMLQWTVSRFEVWS